jgi:hypothetical protein
MDANDGSYGMRDSITIDAMYLLTQCRDSPIAPGWCHPMLHLYRPRAARMSTNMLTYGSI